MQQINKWKHIKTKSRHLKYNEDNTKTMKEIRRRRRTTYLNIIMALDIK